MPISIDTTKSLSRIKGKQITISWSKFQHFAGCHGNWAVTNYLTPTDSKDIYWNDNLSIPGTVIQKLLEVFINGRVYRDPRMKTMGDIDQWVTDQVGPLLDTIYFTEEQVESYLMKHASAPNWFFRTNEGKAHKVKHTTSSTHPLTLKGVQPQILDPERFAEDHHTLEDFKIKMAAIAQENIRMFATQGIPLDKTTSEIHLRVPFEDIFLTGKADFVVNQGNPHPFTELRALKDGFVTLDGKFNISLYTKREQLQFYASLLALLSRKRPGSVGLLNWSKQEPTFFSFDPQFIEKVKTQSRVQRDKILELRDRLQDLEQQGATTISLDDLPVNISPSQGSCKFCPLNKACPKADFK